MILFTLWYNDVSSYVPANNRYFIANLKTSILAQQQNYITVRWIIHVAINIRPSVPVSFGRICCRRGGPLGDCHGGGETIVADEAVGTTVVMITRCSNFLGNLRCKNARQSAGSRSISLAIPIPIGTERVIPITVSAKAWMATVAIM